MTNLNREEEENPLGDIMESNISAISEARSEKKKASRKVNREATIADLDILCDRIYLIEEELDQLHKLVNKLVRVTGDMGRSLSKLKIK